MQPADIGRLVTASDPRVSPDGARVAFVVTRVDLERNRYHRRVWLAAVDRSTPPVPLTEGPGDGAPRWSPDGRRLAFTRSDDDSHELRVLPVEGPGETITLARRDEAVEEPAWSPDGTTIAFSSRVRRPRYGQGDDDRARPPRRIDRLFARLDGTGWTVDRPRQVHVVPADGSRDPRALTEGPHEHASPAWSPDSRTLAVTAGRHDAADLHLRDDVHLVDVTGGVTGTLRTLTDDGLDHQLPAFSPDGTRVATLTTDLTVIPSHSRITTTDVATGATRRVEAPDRQYAPFPGARAPIWTGPDTLLVSCEHHGRVVLQRVGPAVDDVVDDRVVTGFDDTAGTLAFTAATPTSLPELHVVRDGAERRLTGLAEVFHADVPPPARDAFTVPSPKGDTDLDVWVAHPADPAPGERVPVLLSIHGGPMSQYAAAWFDEFSLWTGAGYAVVWTNPHGSTGDTEAFSREVRTPEAEVAPGTGWAGVAADDVLAALDAALERHPDLDPDRVGVLGGSYGGFMTTHLVAATDRFAAACSERAANNLESLEWSSDAAGEFRWELGVSHLDRPDVYRRESPVHRAADITTPLLIVHSEDDLRCPPEQADALFVALRLLGRDVEYWRFPAEGHELSRSGSPRHRVQRAELILEFFARHLGGRRPEITWDHPSVGSGV